MPLFGLYHVNNCKIRLTNLLDSGLRESFARMGTIKPINLKCGSRVALSYRFPVQFVCRFNDMSKKLWTAWKTIRPLSRLGRRRSTPEHRLDSHSHDFESYGRIHSSSFPTKIPHPALKHHLVTVHYQSSSTSTIRMR